MQKSTAVRWVNKYVIFIEEPRFKFISKKFLFELSNI